MEYDTFLKFSRDFGIFPDFCNKITLHSVFYALAFERNKVKSTSEASIIYFY